VARVVIPEPCPSAAAYRRHLRNGEDCPACREKANEDRREKAQNQGPGYGKRPDACDMWPGITAGHDSRCSCSWAPMAGRYQVKVRDSSCLNHGGELGAVLARMARWRQGVS
jgi:hypothetical protein